MTKCTHCETCEDCHEALRREKAMAVLKNELRREIADLLGVPHMRGEPQLRTAVAAIKRLKGVPVVA